MIFNQAVVLSVDEFNQAGVLSVDEFNQAVGVLPVDDEFNQAVVLLLMMSSIKPLCCCCAVVVLLLCCRCALVGGRDTGLIDLAEVEALARQHSPKVRRTRAPHAHSAGRILTILRVESFDHFYWSNHLTTGQTTGPLVKPPDHWSNHRLGPPAGGHRRARPAGPAGRPRKCPSDLTAVADRTAGQIGPPLLL